MKRTLIAALALALVASLPAGTAFAYPGNSSCVQCHPLNANVIVNVTPGYCVGTAHTYSVTVSNTFEMQEGWAVFDGTTNIRNGYGNFGSFMLAQDKTYAVRGVSDSDTTIGGGKGGSNLFTLAVPHCTDCSQDADLDGYFAEALGCGPRDCNDANAAIHPGAAEIRNDGIDQDCNGYDLTINVTKATWSQRRYTLTVEATSAYGQGAFLSVYRLDPATNQYVYVGAMSLNLQATKWVGVYNLPLAVGPTRVMVSGVEGSVTAPVQGGK